MDRKVHKYIQKSCRDLSENGCQGPKSVSGLGLESVPLSIPITRKSGPKNQLFVLKASERKLRCTMRCKSPFLHRSAFENMCFTSYCAYIEL